MPSSGRSMGDPGRMTALTRLKMAVLAPMPSASEHANWQRLADAMAAALGTRPGEV